MVFFGAALPAPYSDDVLAAFVPDFGREQSEAERGELIKAVVQALTIFHGRAAARTRAWTRAWTRWASRERCGDEALRWPGRLTPHLSRRLRAVRLPRVVASN